MRKAIDVARRAARVIIPVALAWGLATMASAPARADDAPGAAAPATAPKDTVRPEVGKPLQAAQALMKDKKYKDALAKIHEAELIPQLTAYEKYVIDQMRGSAAANDGQDEIAVASFESVVNSGRMPAAETLKLEMAVAVTYYNKLKDYSKAAKWASRYMKEGGTDPTAQDLVINSYYLNNEYAPAIVELKNLLEADEKANRTTSEQHLQLLLSCYVKTSNAAGVSSTLERLLISYPKTMYWDQAISHLVHKAAFAERLELDLLRLRFVLGDFKHESDYMDMVQLSLEAGFPAEAKKVIDKGYASGALGKGNEAAREKRLQAMADKAAADDLKAIGSGDVDADKAKTGDGLLNSGFNYVMNGKFEKGLSLMEQGIRKGGLKRPEDGKLHLGIAYYMAGDRSRAVQILRTVQGNDGVGDLAHLWAVFAGRTS
jgi:hypothetical protein